jgi:hypothetical protein
LQPYLKDFYVPMKKMHMNDTFVKSSNNTTEMEEEDDLEETIGNMCESALGLSYNLDKIKASMVLKNLNEYF